MQVNSGKVGFSLQNREVTAGFNDSCIQYYATSALPVFKEYLKY